MTSAKHYIAYEQEHFRQMSDAITYGFNITEPGSANLDDVTMHELYLWPFAGKFQDCLRIDLGRLGGELGLPGRRCYIYAPLARRC